MAYSHGTLTVHVTAPREQLAAWGTWVMDAEPRIPATVAPSALVATQLSQWLGRRFGGGAMPPVVAWNTGGLETDDDVALWADVLAPGLEATLSPTSPYRGAPGAVSAVLRAARVLHVQGVPPDRARELPLALAEAMTSAGEWWTRVGWGLDEGRRIREELVGDGPLAVYGEIGDARDWVLAQARERPVHLFAGSADEGGEARPLGAALAWWRRQGAQVLNPGPVRPPEPSERLAVVVGEPDDIRWAVAGALGRAGAPQDALVVAPRGSAAALARDLRGMGYPAAAYPPPRIPSPGLAAWEASVERPPLASLMEWARSRENRGAAGERVQLLQHIGHASQWPSSVRTAYDAMAQARAALVAARDWSGVGRLAAQWAVAAGVPLGAADPALARWDAARVPTAPPSIEAWMLARLHEPGAVPPDASVWVVEADAAAEGFTPSTLVLVGDAADPGPALGPGDVPAVLTERVRAQLGLATADVRRTEARERRGQLVLRAQRVWVVVDEARGVSLAAGAPRVEAPRHHGIGLGAAVGRSEPRFGAFDGQFPPGAVPAPHSASGFERFGRCPLQYAWRALGVEPMPVLSAEPDPRSIGSWMHRVLAEAAGRVPAPSPVAVRALLERAVQEDPPAATVVPGLLAGRLDRLVADLAAVLAASPAEGTLATELSWEVSWRGAPLQGVMDRVDRRPDGTVLVVDYKSGEPPAGTVDPTRLQLALYAYAASATLQVPLEAVSAAYWGITSQKGFAQRTLEPPIASRWAEAEAILAGVLERVGAGELFMFPGPNACRTCDWRAACPAEAEALGRQKASAAPQFVRLWPDRGEGNGDADAPD